MNAPLMTAMLAEDSDIARQEPSLSSRLEDCWDEPPPPCANNGTCTAHDELQGAWFSVLGPRDAQFLVTGNRFTVRFADGDIYMGSFQVNPAASPRTMDMRIDEGPARHKGKTALCIYELDGSSFRWCAALPGREERLTAFPALDNPQALFITFRREQPVC